jgi:NAD(P)-dependent dehydrogenase (short-subunit alcohol dehydrogenase family)
MVAMTTREFGPINILVNNAATNISFGPCLEIDEAQFDKMIEINLKSAFRLMKAIAPGMCDRGSGAIVNIASVAGLRPQRHSLLYSMTKAALIMMTQSYALELGPKGVRVNAIAPGLIQTALSEHYWKDEEQRASRNLRCYSLLRRVLTSRAKRSPWTEDSCFPAYRSNFSPRIQVLNTTSCN